MDDDMTHELKMASRILLLCLLLAVALLMFCTQVPL